jgi:hypothetical protein
VLGLFEEVLPLTTGAEAVFGELDGIAALEEALTSDWP